MEFPYYKNEEGRNCIECNKKFSIVTCFEKINNGTNEGKIEWSWRSSKCYHKFSIMYRTGAHVEYLLKDYDKDYKTKKVYEKLKQYEDENKKVNLDLVLEIETITSKDEVVKDGQ